MKWSFNAHHRTGDAKCQKARARPVDVLISYIALVIIQIHTVSIDFNIKLYGVSALNTELNLMSLRVYDHEIENVSDICSYTNYNGVKGYKFAPDTSN